MKKSQTTSKSSAKTAKSSVKNKITAATKTVKKPEIKKTVKAAKAPGTKLSGPKTASKPAAPKSGTEIKKPLKTIEVKKPVKGNIAAKKPDKTSAAIAKGKKARPKESLETISFGKSSAPGKKPLKKSPVKIVTAKTKATQEKTIKPLTTKKPSLQKVSKVVAGKTEGKTVKEIKAPAKTAGAAIKEKKSTIKTVKTAGPKVTPKKTIKPLITKKPSLQKVSKVVAGKTEGKTVKGIKAPAKTAGAAIKGKKSTAKTVNTGPLQKKSAISSTIPQIKETVKKETILKPKGKTKATLSTSIKTINKKVKPSLIAPGPPTSIIKKSVAPNTTAPQAETKPKKASKLKVFLPQEELLPEEAQMTHHSQLPQEYGENELLLMEVDPSIVFVSWEIKPDAISGETGSLALRVYDVTGIDFDGTNANRSFDISLRKRAGSKFFDIKMQGKDIIMEIGLLHPDGTFKAIKQSNRASMPTLQDFDEFGITGSSSDTETLIGY